LNDLRRSLTPLEPDGTLIAVIEMSQSSWLVAGPTARTILTANRVTGKMDGGAGPPPPPPPGAIRPNPARPPAPESSVMSMRRAIIAEVEGHLLPSSSHPLPFRANDVATGDNGAEDDTCAGAREHRDCIVACTSCISCASSGRAEGHGRYSSQHK
jgi:hypothetical protein